MPFDSTIGGKQDKQKGTASNAPRRFWRRCPSPPPPFQEDSIGEDDIASVLVTDDVSSGQSRSDEHDSMNKSMALMDLNESSYLMSVKRGSMFGRKKRFHQLEKKPVQSILRNGGGSRDIPKARTAVMCKRLTFALSPTFISEAKLRQAVPDSIANESVLSLDGDDIFDIDEPNTNEASLRLGDSSDERPTRRSSMSQFKAKSSLGFDERFVGFSESEMGSFGNFSCSSI